MEQLPKENEAASVPTITLPLPLFLEILWGYKKGELRERAVPGKEISALLSQVPNYTQYYHIQKQDGCEDTIWQKEFWRSSGERQVQRDEALARLWKGIDHVVDILQKKYPPVFGREALRQMASDLITGEKWETLEAIGIDCSEYKAPK